MALPITLMLRSRIAQASGTSSTLSLRFGGLGIMDPHEEMDINEESLAFYFAIGLAITQWAHVEIALASIATMKISKATRTKVRVGFFSIENFRGKLSFADAMISPYLSRKNKEIWAGLMDRAAKIAKFRNSLAHGWVLVDTERKPGRRRRLLPMKPQVIDPLSKRDRPGLLCVRDIRKAQLEFFALMTTLENFAARLGRRKMLHPKSQEQLK
ncbi:MAG: hypothetical protein ABL996_22680, partial [Micropepsaceae bacterium]